MGLDFFFFLSKCKSHLKNLKCRFLGSHAVNLVWGPGMCILTEAPGDYDAGGPWTTLSEALL